MIKRPSFPSHLESQTLPDERGDLPRNNNRGTQRDLRCLAQSIHHLYSTQGTLTLHNHHSAILSTTDNYQILCTAILFKNLFEGVHLAIPQSYTLRRLRPMTFAAVREEDLYHLSRHGDRKAWWPWQNCA